jgi:hypothetical protein
MWSDPNGCVPKGVSQWYAEWITEPLTFAYVKQSDWCLTIGSLSIMYVLGCR